MRRLWTLFALVFFVPCAFAQSQELVFTSVPPCVAFDTRPSQGGSGAFAPEQEKTFHIVGSTANFAGQGGDPNGCGVPGFNAGVPQAQAVFINYVAIDPQGPGQVKAWAGGNAAEPAQGAMVNYQALTPSMNNSNGVVTELRQDVAGNDIKLKAKSSGVHVRGVILGYFSRDHKHEASDLTSGTIADERISSVIARDNEVMNIVTANDGAGSFLDADTLDGQDSAAFAPTAHNHDSDYERKYLHIVTVRSAGTPLQNGTALMTAHGNITGNSAAEPYLLKLEPGIYDLGILQLEMKPYVDLMGSGETLTTIRRNGGAGAASSAVVRGANNSSLKHLTLENNGGGAAYSFGFVNVTEVSNLYHVTVRASGALENHGIDSYTGPATFEHVTVHVAGTGSADSYGISLSTGSTTLSHCLITASGGDQTFGVYTTNSSSAVLRRTTVSVAGGASNTGIRHGSALTMDLFDTEVLVAGGISNVGIFLNNGPVYMIDSSAVASNGSNDNTGILVGSFATYGGTIIRSAISAFGGVSNLGVNNANLSQVVKIHGSIVGGTNNSIYSNGGEIHVATSQLIGNAGGTAAKKCVFSYNLLFAPLTDSCS
jgi:hypothetical protein